MKTTYYLYIAVPHLRFSMVQKFLSCVPRISRGNFYSFEKKVSFLSNFILTNHKKNLTTKDVKLTERIYNISLAYWRNALAYSICHKVEIHRPVKRLTTSFGYTTFGFLHYLLMTTTFSKLLPRNVDP